MLLAFRADVQVLLQIFFPDDLPATFTLYPQPFGADFLLPRRIQFAGLSLKPSHGAFRNDQLRTQCSIPRCIRARSHPPVNGAAVALFALTMRPSARARFSADRRRPSLVR